MVRVRFREYTNLGGFEIPIYEHSGLLPQKLFENLCKKTVQFIYSAKMTSWL